MIVVDDINMIVVDDINMIVVDDYLYDNDMIMI